MADGTFSLLKIKYIYNHVGNNTLGPLCVGRTIWLQASHMTVTCGLLTSSVQCIRVSVPVSSSMLWQGCTVPAAVVDCTHTEGEREGKEV